MKEGFYRLATEPMQLRIKRKATVRSKQVSQIFMKHEKGKQANFYGCAAIGEPCAQFSFYMVRRLVP